MRETILEKFRALIDNQLYDIDEKGDKIEVSKLSPLSIEQWENLIRYAEENMDLLKDESVKNELRTNIQKMKVRLKERQEYQNMKPAVHSLMHSLGNKAIGKVKNLAVNAEKFINTTVNQFQRNKKKFATVGTMGLVLTTSLAGCTATTLQPVSSAIETEATTDKQSGKLPLDDTYNSQEYIEATKTSGTGKDAVQEKGENYKVTHKNSIDNQTKLASSSLKNGIYTNETLTYRNYLIANMYDLQIRENDTQEVKEQKEKLLKEAAASPIQINANYWDSYMMQVMDDSADITKDTIPFDAHDLFIFDTDGAQRINDLLNVIALLNENPNNTEALTHLNRLTEDFMAHKDEMNPAVGTMFLSLLKQLAQPGRSIHTNFENTELFDNVNSELSAQREKLEGILTLNSFSVAKLLPNSTVVANSISDTSTLDKYELACMKGDSLAKLQIKFAANYQSLTPADAQNFANTLQLNGTMNTYAEFLNEYSTGVVDGTISNENFNLQDLFATKGDDTKENAVDYVSSLVDCISGAKNAKTEEELAKRNDEINDLCYKAIHLDSDFNISNPTSILFMQLVVKAQNSDLGLHVSDDLYTILTGGEVNIDCNLLKQTTDQYGNIESHESLFAQQLQDFQYGISNLIIPYDLSKNQDTSSIAGSQPKIYEEAINTYLGDLRKANMSGGEDLYTAITSSVREGIKDVEFVPNADRETLYNSLSDAEIANLYGTGGEWVSNSSYTADYTIPASETVSVVGSGSADNGTEIMTQDQIDQTEAAAKDELNQDQGHGFTKDDNGNIVPVVDETFEDVPDEVVEETTEKEDLPADTEANEKAEEDGAITEEEKNEMDQNDETFEGKDQNGNDVSFGQENEDVNLSDEGLAALEALEDAFSQGTVSQEEYDQKVIEIMNQYTKTDENKTDEPETNNTENENKTDETENKQPENTDNKVPDAPSERPTYEELLAVDPNLTREEYDAIYNGNIELGEKPAPGTVLEKDGVIFIANENGEYIQQVDPNVSNEDISTEFEEATKEEQEANTVTQPETAAPQEQSLETEAAVQTPETASIPETEAQVAEPETQAIPDPAVELKSEVYTAPAPEAVAEAETVSTEQQLQELKEYKEQLMTEAEAMYANENTDALTR